MDTDNNAKAIIEAARQFGEAVTIDIGEVDGRKVEILTLPNGRTASSLKGFLDMYRKAPDRKKGTATLHTEDSFVEHVGRSKDADSVIFADVQGRNAKLLAVYDYNEANEPSEGEGSLAVDGEPRFGEHRAVYSFPVSDEWKAWNAAAEKPMEQASFAEFLEERIVDVVDPDMASGTLKDFAELTGISFASPQRLLELSKGLSVRVDMTAGSYHNLKSGETSLTFKEAHHDDQGQPLKVPSGFVIAIPVFKLGIRYPLGVRLRYRVDGSRVKWSVSIHLVDRAWDDAVREACERVQGLTQLPLFYGTPET